jgi:hypothetical protein
MGVVPPFIIEDEKVTGVPKQILFAEAKIVIPGDNGFITVIIIVLLLAVFPVMQVALEVSVQLIMSPLIKELSL